MTMTNYAEGSDTEVDAYFDEMYQVWMAFVPQRAILYLYQTFVAICFTHPLI